MFTIDNFSIVICKYQSAISNDIAWWLRADSFASTSMTFLVFIYHGRSYMQLLRLILLKLAALDFCYNVFM